MRSRNCSCQGPDIGREIAGLGADLITLSLRSWSNGALEIGRQSAPRHSRNAFKELLVPGTRYRPRDRRPRCRSDHAELETLVERRARNRTPVRAKTFPQCVQGTARARDPI